MDQNQKKLGGILCLVVCAFCVFVAIERYSANASNVRALNQYQQTSPLGHIVGGGASLKPSTPAATKYAIFFALIFGVGGGVLLVQNAQAVQAAKNAQLLRRAQETKADGQSVPGQTSS